MNNKELELLFGAICFMVAIILGIREYRIWNALQNDDWMLKSNSIGKIGGIVGQDYLIKCVNRKLAGACPR